MHMVLGYLPLVRMFQIDTLNLRKQGANVLRNYSFLHTDTAQFVLGCDLPASIRGEPRIPNS